MKLFRPALRKSLSIPVLIGSLLLIIAAAFQTAKAIPDGQAFAIAGTSMAPTLVGPTEELHCSTCYYTGRLAIEPSQRAHSASDWVCPQCGDDLTRSGKRHRGDRVRCQLGRIPSEPGSLVAIDLPSGPVIKRVVGMPGDVIGVKGRHLMVNGQHADQWLWPDEDDDNAPSVLVYHQTSPDSSRWIRQGAWWVYHHVNVHRGGLPGPILDEYPINLGLARQLDPAGHVFVTSASTGERIDRSLLVRWSADHDRDSPPVLTETSPLAISDPGNQMRPTDFQVRRRIEYRLRRRDNRGAYPVTLRPGQYFVLGDNTPVSVDSRDYGPVSKSQIMGVVSPERTD